MKHYRPVKISGAVVAPGYSERRAYDKLAVFGGGFNNPQSVRIIGGLL